MCFSKRGQEWWNFILSSPKLRKKRFCTEKVIEKFDLSKFMEGKAQPNIPSTSISACGPRNRLLDYNSELALFRLAVEQQNYLILPKTDVFRVLLRLLPLRPPYTMWVQKWLNAFSHIPLLVYSYFHVSFVVRCFVKIKHKYVNIIKRFSVTVTNVANMLHSKNGEVHTGP